MEREGREKRRMKYTLRFYKQLGSQVCVYVYVHVCVCVCVCVCLRGLVHNDGWACSALTRMLDCAAGPCTHDFRTPALNATPLLRPSLLNCLRTDITVRRRNVHKHNTLYFLGRDVILSSESSSCLAGMSKIDLPRLNTGHHQVFSPPPRLEFDVHA